MLKYFFKTAWRHLTKNPVISFIQVAGLTIGLTVFMLILLWVNNQISFDRFSKYTNRIYRLELYSPEFQGWTEMSLGIGPNFKNNIAGIENFVRIRDGWAGVFRWKPADSEDFREASFENNIWADSSFFSVFSFRFIYGDPVKALQSPNGVVLTESLSKKLFGNEYPVGHEIIMYGSNLSPFTVTGVIKDVNNFHIPFQCVVSFDNLKEFYRRHNYTFEWDAWKSSNNHPTYFLLHKNSTPDVISRQMTDLFQETEKNLNPDNKLKLECRLRPLKEIYFFGKTEREFNYVIHGNIRLVSGLTIIGLLILLLACVNFINLNTTRTFARSKEIGIRKIAGSGRSNIFGLFTGEVIILCILSFVISLFLIQLLLPYYNNLISTNLSFSEIFNKYNFVTISGSFLLMIILAGAIPSVFISHFSPIAAIRSFQSGNSKKNMTARKLFLVIQYGITIIVIAVTLVVQKQLNYMKNSYPGFNISNVLWTTYPYDTNKSDERKELFKNRILEHPDVVKAAFCYYAPPRGEPTGPAVKFNDKILQLERVPLYPEYFDLLEIPVVAGRNFLPDNQADKWDSKNNMYRVMLNETAVKKFGIENPVGYTGTLNSKMVEIIGVVKDYHLRSLKSEIPPMIFIFYPYTYTLLIKTKSENYQGVIQHIAKVKKELFDQVPYHNILSESYNKQYESEEQLAKLFIWFSMLSVLIAAMGLYGISSNAIQRRIKEIGIRKAHGATSWNITALLQAYFTKIVLGAGIIALPVAWYLLTRWLLNYPYKTSLSWWVFAGALAFALFIAILTISWKTWRAASSNPVNALRYE